MKYSYCVMVFEAGDTKHKRVQEKLKAIADEEIIPVENFIIAGQLICDTINETKNGLIETIKK